MLTTTSALIIHDAKYLPPLKLGGYGFSARLSGFQRDRLNNANIDRQVLQGIDRGVRPAVRQKLVNLIKKVRKKTGKTYYQRTQLIPFQQVARQPLTTKPYIKGVDFSYPNRDDL
jgi:hypothetical protein